MPQYGQAGGVSKRCVEKDIEYLEYKFPILIEFERYTVDAHSVIADRTYRKRCIRYADPTFSLFKGKLTEEEKGLLTAVLSILGSFEGLDGFGWLDDFSKRFGLVKTEPVIQMSKNLLENRTLMAEVFSAIRACTVIKLQYKLFNNSNEREVVVSPFLLKEYNRRWYLIGAADDTGKLLTFALDRITSIILLPGYEYRKPPEDLLERYEDIIGVSYYEDHEILKIIFWVSDKSAPYVDTKPLHGSQINIKGEKEEMIREQFNLPVDGSVFSIECKENYELIRELCSFGGDLKVVSPKTVVDSVKQRIKSMVELYQV